MTCAGRAADSASTVGGYHSSRDLCSWPAVRATRLQPLLASAVAWPAIAIHLDAMIGLALGLFGSLNWVAKELQREKAD